MKSFPLAALLKSISNREILVPQILLQIETRPIRINLNFRMNLSSDDGLDALKTVYSKILYACKHRVGKVDCFKYVMLYGYLCSASRRRLFRGVLSMTGR